MKKKAKYKSFAPIATRIKKIAMKKQTAILTIVHSLGFSQAWYYTTAYRGTINEKKYNAIMAELDAIENNNLDYLIL